MQKRIDGMLLIRSQEVVDIIAEGESVTVEFKEDTVRAERLAREVVAFANGLGGKIILGVSDRGKIVGVTKRNMEEWVMNICRNNCRPAIVPTSFEQIKVKGKRIAILTIPRGVDKPYETGNRCYVRVGTTVRQATREERGRLYLASGTFYYDTFPVAGTSMGDLDPEKIRDYFATYRSLDTSTLGVKLERLLVNTQLMREQDGSIVATVAGVLLFGRDAASVLPQSGITAAKFRGKTMDYDTEDKKEIEGTLPALVEEALRFVKRNTKTASRMRGARRVDKDEYPGESVREVLVNGLVHRDYSVTGSRIRLFIYSDRFELRTPGPLPNTVDLEKIKAGCSYCRNPVLARFMQNYGYIERFGLGIPVKIIQRMLEYGSPEPAFEEIAGEFRVILYPVPSG